MTKEIFKVNCCEKMKQLDELSSILFEYSANAGKFHMFNETEKEVINGLHKLLAEREKEVDSIQNSLCDFFRTKLKRYWRMNLKTISSSNVEYNNIYMVYPYELLEDNHYLCCLKTGVINSEHCYWSEFKDAGFTLDDFMNSNLTIEMEEVTKEEFISESKKCIDNIIEHRLSKI